MEMPPRGYKTYRELSEEELRKFIGYPSNIKDCPCCGKVDFEREVWRGPVIEMWCKTCKKLLSIDGYDI